MGVTHFLILSKTETSSSPFLRVALQRLLKIVLSGFAAGDEHLKLTTTMFKNIFPDIDINSVKLSSCQRIVLLNYNKDTKLIDFRHYSITLQPVGVSRRIHKLVQNHQVPNLRNLQDVNDFITEYHYELYIFIVLSS
ncbi:Peter Pan-like protein [Hibiscus syriacus]|uniref:Peter Pan-like protein n=1 Tax=Hibiscus syriacus TaxID=106335 RepID=A0A6A2Y6S7_HIBSY|nr:Peter Pan-like protein [Hibiscus syriacus]